MRLLSWNVRGLGSLVKRRRVGEVIRKHRFDMALLQESKLKELIPSMVAGMWYSDGFEFSFSPSVGASGGILAIWEGDRFVLESVEIERHFVMLHGRWKHEDMVCCFMVVYAPCEVSEQEGLWLRLVTAIDSYSGPWCVVGDFNAVLRPSERAGCSSLSRGMTSFVSFVNDACLIDFPLRGKL
ncbi:hypothetical protein HRI_000666500 [Hibiscus trionum]|uniref:Endonuclease/exonuclease/phosphatase domain-containing protein n=1 Tax=Hibiscus trionum TaxID=183268 RepID=A0A9W7H3G1_HIBTR|nr:hypothetical protein HRI_000666500 [Hibiscus trionum]